MADNLVTFNASEAALLVIDMQNDFLHKDGVFSRQGLGHDYKDIIANNVRMINLCRDHNIPVIYSRQVIHRDKNHEPVDAGSLLRLRPFLKREGLTPETWGCQVIDELPEPDYTVDKQRFSAFYNTNLELLLRGLNVKQLLIQGVITFLCVETTFREAWIRDYQVWLVEDCTGSWSSEFHKATVNLANYLGYTTDLNTFSSHIKILGLPDGE